jgi:hypothetical protein
LQTAANYFSFARIIHVKRYFNVQAHNLATLSSAINQLMIGNPNIAILVSL